MSSGKEMCKISSGPVADLRPTETRSVVASRPGGTAAARMKGGPDVETSAPPRRRGAQAAQRGQAQRGGCRTFSIIIYLYSV